MTDKEICLRRIKGKVQRRDYGSAKVYETDKVGWAYE